VNSFLSLWLPRYVLLEISVFVLHILLEFFLIFSQWFIDWKGHFIFWYLELYLGSFLSLFCCLPSCVLVLMEILYDFVKIYAVLFGFGQEFYIYVYGLDLDCPIRNSGGLDLDCPRLDDLKNSIYVDWI